MLESVTVLFIGIAVFFTTLMLLIRYNQQPQQGVVGLFATIFWFINSAMIVSVDVPYSHLFENTVDNTYSVVSGVQSVTANAPLAYLMLGLGFVCLGYTIINIIAMFLKIRTGEEGE